jgi:IS1 transposase
MQKIERKHLTLQTRLKRLARKTLCFSRSCVMHDFIIGLYMNRMEFGCRYNKGANTELEHYPSRARIKRFRPQSQVLDLPRRPPASFAP